MIKLPSIFVKKKKIAAVKAEVSKERAPTLDDLFEDIEHAAAALLRLLEEIPEGATHGYHTLAAELRGRLPKSVR